MKTIENTEPTLTGPAGRAWRQDLNAIRAKCIPNKQDATLASWIIEAPWANCMWPHYWLALIHLRQLDDKRPTKIYLPGATHEIWIYALDPREKITLDDLPHFLTPMNFAAQFIEPGDQRAQDRVCSAVVEILDGRLSPDTDYIKQWYRRFGDNMIKAEYRERAGETIIMLNRGDHTEKVVFDPKDADAIPRCIHGVLPVDNCKLCEAIRSEIAKSVGRR